MRRLVGFCLLARAEVFRTVGLFDEGYSLGNFEDDDYCRRALGAGFRCVVARDAFVHHFGGRTFAGAGIDFAQLMTENERKYQEKWAEVTSADTGQPSEDSTVRGRVTAVERPRSSTRESSAAHSWACCSS